MEPPFLSAAVSTFLLNFIVQLSREFLRRLAYGSVVGALLVTLVVSSSGWRAAGAAFAHADLAASEFVGALLGPGVVTNNFIFVGNNLSKIKI